MNMHDRVNTESSGIPSFELFRSFLFILFVSLFDFWRKGSNKLEILKLFSRIGYIRGLDLDFGSFMYI